PRGSLALAAISTCIASGPDRALAVPCRPRPAQGGMAASARLPRGGSRQRPTRVGAGQPIGWLLAFAVLFTSVGAPPAGAPTVGGFLYTTVGAVAAGKVREYGTQ